jgi:signal transduction histidine kinase
MEHLLPSYAANVASAALRHDFGKPLGLIGRNAAQFAELIEQDAPDLSRVRDRINLKRVCERVAADTDQVESLLEQFGEEIEPLTSIDNPSPRWRIRIELAYSRMHAAVFPLLSSLPDQCRLILNLLRAGHTIPGDIEERSANMVMAAQRVNAMYDGLRYFFRLEDISSSFIKVQLDRLIETVVTTVQLGTPNGGRVDCRILGGCDIEALPPQVVLIFQNLLANAFKFTAGLTEPQVRIQITRRHFPELQARFPAQLQRYTATGEWAEVLVSDNGVGIDPRIQNRIFELYYTTNPEELNASGTGMGLAIAKLAAMLHGGTIFVGRSPQPTVFAVCLPIMHRNGISLQRLTRLELSLTSRG